MKKIMILGFLLASLFFVSGCEDLTTTKDLITDETTTSTKLDYSDFESTHIYYASGILTKESNDYYVYYYSEYCGHCTDIKETVLNYASNQSMNKFYFVDAVRFNQFGMPDELKEVMRGTPVLLHVLNNQLAEYYIGSIEIPEFIN